MLNQFTDSSSFSCNGALNWRNPKIVFCFLRALFSTPCLVRKWREMKGGTVVRIKSLDRMPQSEHGLQRLFSILHSGPIRLVDDQDISNLKNARFNGLNIVAKSGRLHDQWGMGQLGDIHLALSLARRFD